MPLFIWTVSSFAWESVKLRWIALRQIDIYERVNTSAKLPHLYLIGQNTHDLNREFVLLPNVNRHDDGQKEYKETLYTMIFKCSKMKQYMADSMCLRSN